MTRTVDEMSRGPLVAPAAAAAIATAADATAAAGDIAGLGAPAVAATGGGGGPVQKPWPLSARVAEVVAATVAAFEGMEDVL